MLLIKVPAPSFLLVQKGSVLQSQTRSRSPYLQSTLHGPELLGRQGHVQRHWNKSMEILDGHRPKTSMRHGGFCFQVQSTAHCRRSDCFRALIAVDSFSLKLSARHEGPLKLWYRLLFLGQASGELATLHSFQYYITGSPLEGHSPGSLLYRSMLHLMYTRSSPLPAMLGPTNESHFGGRQSETEIRVGKRRFHQS